MLSPETHNFIRLVKLQRDVVVAISITLTLHIPVLHVSLVVPSEQRQIGVKVFPPLNWSTHFPPFSQVKNVQGKESK